MKVKQVLGLAVVVMILVMTVPATSFGQADRSHELFQTASQQFWNGRYERSLENYRRIVEGYPDSQLYWDAVFGAAKSLYELGELNRARKVFQRVQKNHPEKAVRGDALFSMVEVAILQDDIVRARNLLRTFLKVYDDHPIRETAKRQLELLTRNPALNSGQDDGGTETEMNRGSATPPKLKSSGNRQGKPESFPMQSAGGTQSATPPQVRNEKSLRSETPAIDRPSGRSRDGSKSRISPIASKGEGMTDTTGMPEGTDSTSEEEDSGPSLGDLSTNALRQLRNQNVKNNRPEEAYRSARKILDRSSATSRDFYQAASLSHQLDKPVSTSMKFLAQAMKLAEDPPPKFNLLKSELMMTGEKLKEASTLLQNYMSNSYTDAPAPQKARFHFLKAELLRRRGKNDEAFFQYMSALQVAPDSRWGSKAQQTVKKEF